MNFPRRWLNLAGSILLLAGFVQPGVAAETNRALGWPAIAREQKPWAYWWWMGSAVDRTNITRELERYRDAGLGGVHIIPIYGAKGWESNYVRYLSPQWMELLRHTVTEAERLDMGVDMTTGTGWCFGGGPNVGEAEGNASVVMNSFELAAGEALTEKFDIHNTQALVAFWPDGQSQDLTGLITTNSDVLFTPLQGPVRVYAISQKLSSQKVKRAAPGGEGPMLNLLYPAAMTNYLRWFSDAFDNYQGPKPRAQYHDSYEYKSDWAPDFFAQFERRRGYKLQVELPALFGTNTDDRTARVKCDYRETVSDLMVEQSLPEWVAWSHAHGFITRNEAHGSPGNLLDLYAVADIPETEMFRTNRNILTAKFASSAAHVTGKKLVSAETGTWLNEHFTETLGDMKSLVDEMFLAGVNHVFYHGACYSPDEAAWPGWVFYAATQMNPRNPIWRDVPALNAYIARCQSVLQTGQPDNDVLLYWPVHDLWHDPTGRLQNLKVESAESWFGAQAVGAKARELWEARIGFDYVSDRQLQAAKVQYNAIQMPGGKYYSIEVPECKVMPLETLRKLLELANDGVKVFFQSLPRDVSGWGNLETNRAEFRKLLATIPFKNHTAGKPESVQLGKGLIWRGDMGFKMPGSDGQGGYITNSGASFIRRSFDGGWNYFVANRSGTNVAGWLSLGHSVKSAILFDPMTGKSGTAVLGDKRGDHYREIYLELQPGESVIVRALFNETAKGANWKYWRTNGRPVEVSGNWQVSFMSGGPTLPVPFQTTKLGSWTEGGDTNAQSFGGTARYAVTFDLPRGAKSGHWLLNLGRVAQSARVKLNGKDCGTLITSPFQVVVENLKAKGNQLEVEVTSTAANRIRDLDRRGVTWKGFHDINFVNINYKPFDASGWPVAEAGLLGPVSLVPVKNAVLLGKNRISSGW